MSIEQLNEVPKTPSFIARSYAENLADDLQLDLAIHTEDGESWEGQIYTIDTRNKEQRIGPSKGDSYLFVSKLIEFLEEDFPEGNWQTMLSVVDKSGSYHIRFGAI